MAEYPERANNLHSPFYQRMQKFQVAYLFLPVDLQSRLCFSITQFKLVFTTKKQHVISKSKQCGNALFQGAIAITSLLTRNVMLKHNLRWLLQPFALLARFAGFFFGIRLA